VDRLLSRLGYCSRADAKRWVKDARVTVDGVPVARHDVKVLPTAEGGVRIDDQPPDHPDGLIAVLHKPKGVVCSHDEREGPNVYGLLPPRWRNRNPSVEAVGRLDKDTTGLLLFTDDGALSHRLQSPRKNVWKTYEVTLDAPVPPGAVDLFAAGALALEGETKPCKPARLRVDARDRKRCVLRLTEGKFHQVKRMMRAVGCEVLALHRARLGELTLGNTREGDAFVVGRDELEAALVEEEREEEEREEEE
jgi:16S rRNA pseudouridine516 synthase